MAAEWYVRRLLARSRELYDDAGSPLSAKSTQAWRSFFASGAMWMKFALERIRGQVLPGSAWSMNGLGIAKYGLASAGALVCIVMAVVLDQVWPLLLVVPVFYALEAQFVFLFPVALDGSVNPYQDAWRWTRRAGGTLAVMTVVLPLAAVMLLGGFLGQGFVRSWCLGCLSVCIWYEDLRHAHA